MSLLVQRIFPARAVLHLQARAGAANMRRPLSECPATITVSLPSVPPRPAPCPPSHQAHRIPSCTLPATRRGESPRTVGRFCCERSLHRPHLHHRRLEVGSVTVHRPPWPDVSRRWKRPTRRTRRNCWKDHYHALFSCLASDAASMTQATACLLDLFIPPTLSFLA